MIAVYEEDVASFDKIDSAKAQELIKGEGEAVIYIGKAVCPYCQIFVEKLKKVAEETNTHIYYVNSVEELIWKELRLSVMNTTFQRFLVSSIRMVTQ